MSQKDKTKEELIEEIKLLKKRIEELKTVDTDSEQQQMRRLAMVVRDSNDAITLKDFDGQITAWNRGAERMYGYSEKEALQMNARQLTPPDKEIEHTEFIRRLMAGETVSSFETQRVAKDGRILDVWLTVTKVADDTGKPIGIATTERDITERKKNEDSLRESEARYKTLFFSAAEGILVADLETKQFLYANPAMCRMFGYAEEELMRLGVADIHPKESLDRVLAEFEAQIQGEKTLALDLPCLRKDSTLFYADVNATSVVLGSRKCLVGFFADTTERRKASEELKTSQNMLVQSEKLASLGRIAADIAHQVNNPLMIISSNAQLSLMSGSVSAELKDALELIIKECSRASGVMHKTLKFAQPSKGEMTETRICESIEAVVSLIEKQFEMARIEIKRNYPEKPVLVLIDNQLMQEVFMNLLNNAKESMPDGGTITITASLEGDFFRIDFKDTGCGMSEEDKHKIFEPFFTTKRKGTGLGLSICYSIIKAHDGELIFESQLNKGSTATVLLPLRKGKV
jgi:two-component system, sporulation sensor kinase A